MNIQTFVTWKDSAMIMFIDGLTDKVLIDRDIIDPLKSSKFDGNIPLALKTIFRETEDLAMVVEGVLAGEVALFYEKSGKAYLMEFKNWEKRSVSPPEAESVIRGPKESFTESIQTNTVLIRRKIKTPKLMLENMTLGRQTKTAVILVYVEGIVNQQVLSELKYRLSKIDTGEILETGQIEQLICENVHLPISGMGLTQKPDTAAQKILHGKVAILCDGTPHALIIPELFIENLQTSEDYYSRTFHASFMRVMRTIALLISLLTPGLAVAVITFHIEMIPAVFFTSIINATQQIPMPIALETFFLILVFELVQMGGVRLPNNVGSAITIVGSLVIGEAAVSAGIVSRPMLIIVALTAISTFLTPNLYEFIIAYRMFFLFLGSTMGLIGIGTGVFIMMTQMSSMYTFGIPMLSTSSKGELKNSVIRFPLRSLKNRPESIVKDNIRKQG